MSATMSEDGGRLGRIPEQVAQRAAGIGRAVGDAVGPKAEDIADRSKAAGADTVAQDSPAIAEYGRGVGREALASAADVVRKEAAAADLGTKMGELADKIVRTATKDVVRPA